MLCPDEFWIRTSAVYRLADLVEGWGKVKVIFCEAIPTVGLTYDDRDALIAKLRSIAEREIRFFFPA